MIRSLTRSTINNEVWYQSMLVGNAAYNPNSYDLITSTLIASNTASVTFNSLGSYSEYKHLQIRYIARGSGTSDQIDLRFNGLTAANYATHRLRGTGVSVQTSGSSSASSVSFETAMTNNSSASNRFAAGVLDFIDFSNASKNPMVRGLYGLAADPPGNRITQRMGIYPSAQAITSITLIAGGDNFVSGSRFSLYGIKG